MDFVLINLQFLKWEMGINNEKCEFAMEWLWIFLGFDVFSCIDNVGIDDKSFKFSFYLSFLSLSQRPNSAKW